MSLGKYRQISPTGKFPALVHDGGTIVDPTDICRWLEVQFPTHTVTPADPRHAALATILEDWADDALHFLRSGHAERAGPCWRPALPLPTGHNGWMRQRRRKD